MYGRFTKLYSRRELHRLYSLNSVPATELSPSYNVAPTQSVPVIRSIDGQRSGTEMRWGLVPFWAKDLSIGSRLINSRCEEAATKAAFRSAWKSRRCLVPVSGFYEWQAVEGSKTKQPWYFTPADGGVFTFAGLWESWGKDAERVETFTLLTGEPNALVAKLHNRMPRILPAELWEQWLDPRNVSPELPTYHAEGMIAQRVSTRVNSPRNNDETLIAATENER